MTDYQLPPGFHEKSTIEEVVLSTLQIDRSYQREPSQALVDEITANWDEIASELILVSDRGQRPEEGEIKGGRFVVNGQHRHIAAQKRGDTTIWARVVDLSDLEDPAEVEAELRLKLNVRRSDTPAERFKAQLRAHDEASLKIVDILSAFDTQINEKVDMESGINAVSTVESIYKVDDGALLYDTIALLKDTYGHLHGKNVSAGMLRAAAWFIEKHAFETDRYRVVEKMKSIGTEALYRKAISHQSIQGGALWMNYYRAMLELYNENMRDKNRIAPKLRSAGQFGRPTVRWQSHYGGGLGT